MHHSRGEIEQIIARSLTGGISEEEQQKLQVWLNQSDENELLYRLIKEEYQDDEKEQVEAINTKRGWQLFSEKLDKGVWIVSPEKHNYGKLVLSIAASLLVLVGIGSVLYHYLVRPGGEQNVAVAGAKPIPPGGSRATLTLADGAQITLTTQPVGGIALQGNTTVISQNGWLHYKSSYERNHGSVYNTLSTPAGGQYSLILPDGSRVWLNAASSLRFPVPFTGYERRVELTGEAYFQVAHNSARPFKVLVKNEVKQMEIQVLGTSFTVSGYQGEGLTATLLNGSVQVSSGGTGNRLKPGQAASVTAGNISIAQADTAKAIAWKNGNFQFSNDDIYGIMNKLSRWYNIKVIYNTKHHDRYTGTISRNNNLSAVLQMLQHSGLKFQLEGRTLTILQ